MGVPSFYRWLSEKYPSCIQPMKEMRELVVGGVRIPVDATAPNPNEIEFDNFYIDMNGIIHPCAHPEDGEPPKTEIEMYVNVLKSIDRLMNAIRPRKLLYLAVDGVAPRAKMNQQRSRRFMAANAAKDLNEIKVKTRQDMIDLGLPVPEDKGPAWDSNVITPGTKFMTKLSKFIRYYIQHRMNQSKLWRNLKVIFSDASVPGEGEHKIMEYIRRQRSQPGYDPNLRHILHGLDADLIMLGLATHEVFFTISREEVYFGRIDEQKKKHATAARIAAEDAAFGICNDDNDTNNMSIISSERPLQMLHIHILREYLDLEYSMLRQTLPFTYEFERIVDDFVFVCFFVGNDFLPHLPSLDIREGALDYLQLVYKKIIPSAGGYLTYDGGKVNLSAVEMIMKKVGEIEDEIFRRKRAFEDKETNRKMQKKEMDQLGGSQKYGAISVVDSAVAAGSIKTGRYKDALMQNTGPAFSMNRTTVNLKRNASNAFSESSDGRGQPHSIEEHANKVAACIMRGQINKARKVNGDSSVSDAIASNLPSGDGTIAMEATTIESFKQRVNQEMDKKILKLKNSVVDNIRLGENGWKERYYADKCKLEDIQAGGGISRVKSAYVEGLCWVMQYYYQGVTDWKWYYPFHYAPFASDLTDCSTYNIKFSTGKPLRPITQLMAVLPPDSAHALPAPCKSLMLDKKSPIKDFYPEDVVLDPNGKKMPWLWVVILPFIEEKRLLGAIEPLYSDFTEKERKRNEFGPTYLFTHKTSDLYKLIDGMKSSSDGILSISADLTQGWSGTIRTLQHPKLVAAVGEPLKAPKKSRTVLDGVQENMVAAVEYELPPELPHICRILDGAKVPPKTLSPSLSLPHTVRFKFNINIAELAFKTETSQNPSGYFAPSASYSTANSAPRAAWSQTFNGRQQNNHSIYDSPFQGTQYWGHNSMIGQPVRGFNQHQGQNFSPAIPINNNQPQLQRQPHTSSFHENGNAIHSGPSIKYSGQKNHAFKGPPVISKSGRGGYMPTNQLSSVERSGGYGSQGSARQVWNSNSSRKGTSGEGSNFKGSKTTSGAWNTVSYSRPPQPNQQWRNVSTNRIYHANRSQVNQPRPPPPPPPTFTSKPPEQQSKQQHQQQLDRQHVPTMESLRSRLANTLQRSERNAGGKK